jgi:hypothetical protein
MSESLIDLGIYQAFVKNTSTSEEAMPLKARILLTLTPLSRFFTKARQILD